MAMKQGHKKTEMVANNTKMGYNCNTAMKRSTNTIIKYEQELGLTFLSLNTQNTVLKFTLGTYIPL